MRYVPGDVMNRADEAIDEWRRGTTIMKIEVSRMWLWMIYTIIGWSSLAAYTNNSPPHVPVELHKIICFVGFLWWMTAGFWHLALWLRAWSRT